jgi:thioredoxin 1
MTMNTKPKSFNELITGDQPVLVDFFATWCGPCKMMQPILEDAARQTEGKVKIIKVDIDKNPQAANKFQVKGVPTLILFQGGKIKWRQSGVVPSHQLLQVLKDNVGQNV